MHGHSPHAHGHPSHGHGDSTDASGHTTHPHRSSRQLAVLGIVAVLGSALAAVIYQRLQTNEAPTIDATGFDIAQTSAKPRSEGLPRPPSLGSQKPSSLQTFRLPDLPAPQEPEGQTTVDQAPPSPRQPAPQAAAPAAAADDLSAAEKAQAERVGAPRTPQEAAKFGGSYKAFAAVFAKVGKYPRVVKFLLNNKYVVEGYMNRESSRKIFSDPNGVSAYLSDTKGPVGNSLPLLQALLRENPQMAGIVAGSELAQKIYETPGFKGFLQNPTGPMMANPALMGLVTDPGIIQGFASNPAGASALQSFQQNSGMGGLK